MQLVLRGGGGLTVNRFQQVILLAFSQGKKQPGDWMQSVLALLVAKGEMIIKEGKTLETPEENLAELNQQATTFATKQRPIIKALQVI